MFVVHNQLIKIKGYVLSRSNYTANPPPLNSGGFASNTMKVTLIEGKLWAELWKSVLKLNVHINDNGFNIPHHESNIVVEQVIILYVM